MSIVNEQLGLDDELELAPDVMVRFDGAGELHVHVWGRIYRIGRHGLAWLDAFHHLTTVRDAVARVLPEIHGERARSEAAAALRALVAAGALRRDRPPRFSHLPDVAGVYDSAYVQLTMLHDPVRKREFVRAVRRVVQADDVVLDLGSGIGLLAIAAAQAGARHVYAVEPSGVGSLGPLLAERNGVADRMTFLRAWGSDLDLPEPATVLTTDLVGNDGLDMSIWEVVHDVVQRCCAPDVRLVPRGIACRGMLAQVPDEVIRRYRVCDDDVQLWEDRLGIDLAPLAAGHADGCSGFYERPEVVAQWPILSDTELVYELDLWSSPQPLERHLGVVNTAEATANALVLYTAIELDDEFTLGLPPRDATAESHWWSSIWLLPPDAEVERGDTLRAVYRYLGNGSSRVDLLKADVSVLAEAS